MNYQNPHSPGCFWFEWAEKFGSPNIKWCEETLCRVISEPANTWSNLGYLIIGIFISILSIKKNQSSELKQFGPIVFFMGLMSFFYHLSNFYLTQILDFVGMFFFVGWALAMNLNRMRKITRNQILAFNLGLSFSLTILLHTMYVLGVHFQIIILIAAFTIILTEFFAQKFEKTKLNYFFSSLLLLLLAFGFSLADGKRIWCSPLNHGWLSQGHALWHWTASLAMLPLYLHYSNIRIREKD